MINYEKGENIEEELKKENIPIENLPKNFLWMQVKGGTKLFNVVDYAKKALDNDECRCIVWSGSGGGVQKTISCAEIIKRQYKMHQITRICYRKVEEYWEPQNEELDRIVATREIPCIHILLSLDEIDSTSLGYQAPDSKTSFYTTNDSNKNTENNFKTKKSSNSRHKNNNYTKQTKSEKNGTEKNVKT